MKREALFDIVQRLDPDDHSKVVLITRAGFCITSDLIYRFEADYVVIRGREAGTNDDGRAFFVPYEEITYVRLERVVKVNDLRRMFGDPLGVDMDEFMASGGDLGKKEREESKTPTPSSKTPPMISNDPTSIARNNLLDRIRAARTSAGVPRPEAK